MVEQGNHNPLVGGSNPSAATSPRQRSWRVGTSTHNRRRSRGGRGDRRAGGAHAHAGRSRTLSEIAGCEIWLKFENLQFTASFKDRGALNKLLSLTAEERKRGVIAMSAGNHAQGVAYHAGRLGIPATIVMPEGTPFNKVKHTKGFGARVVLDGNDAVGCLCARRRMIAAAENLVFVHPYDDPKVIAGQGTVALEMLADAPDARGAGGADRRRRPDLRASPSPRKH